MVSHHKLSGVAGRVAIIASLVLGVGLLESRNIAKATIVSPTKQTNIEGNGNNNIPFNNFLVSPVGVRYQQVFAAPDFLSIEPGLITEIAFRPDAGRAGNAFSSTIPNIQINLSTTSLLPDVLSTTFTENVGDDETIVYNGELLLSSANIGDPKQPKDFDIVIDLQNPFFYDPNQGNLLLDVRTFSFTRTTAFDSENTFGDSISRVFSFDSSASTGTDDTTGLVTKFTIATRNNTALIPESSSTVALLAFGALTAISQVKRSLSTPK